MLGFEQGWLVLLLDVSVKSIVLATLASLWLWCFRVRNANLQHRVWTAVLLGMLTLPVLVPITPEIPLPGWLMAKFPSMEAPEAGQEGGQEPALTTVVPEANAANGYAWDESRQFTPRLPSEAMFAGEAAAGADAFQDLDPTTSSAAEMPQASPPPARLPARTAPSWPTWVIGTYLLVAGVLGLRVLLGVLGAARIVARSRMVETGRDGGVASVHETDDLRVPFTTGFWRPRILLPSDWRSWSEAKLESVLAHESEHIRRRDYLVTFLAEVNRAIHWFHPLAWGLPNWLSELAERNCDDAVIAFTGQRTQYARHLLEVASSLRNNRGRIAWSGIAMARRANVETRIDAILDPGRPLAQRLGIAGAMLLVVTAVPAVFVAAALRPGATVSAKDVNGAVAVEQQLPSVSGTVLAQDGEPVEGAVVHVRHISWKKDGTLRVVDQERRIAETMSASDGQFRLQLDNLDLGEDDALYVTASTPGYGVVRELPDQLGDSLALELAREQRIYGRILDTEGQPVVGANVRVVRRTLAKSGEAVSQWIENCDPKLVENLDIAIWDDRARKLRFPGDAQQPPHVDVAGTQMTTDNQGRFEVGGFGEDELAVLVVSGAGIAKQLVSVVTREMEPLKAYPTTFEGTPNGLHYGATFDLVAVPSQPIIGVIKSDTGEPIVDAKVRINNFAYSLAHQYDFLTTRTDDEGNFRLDGAPRGGGHSIAVLPAEHEPYFETGLRLQKTTGSQAIQCEMVLPHCVWIEGKVTDDQGEPVHASVHYYPYRDNQHAERFANYDPRITGSGPDEKTKTADDGSFRLKAIPGAGVIGTHVASDQANECLSDIPDELLESIGGSGMSKLYNSWSAKWFHTLRDIEIPADAASVQYDLGVRRGLVRRVNIVDAAGKPIVGAQALGRVSPSGLEAPLKTAYFDMIGLAPGDERLVAVMDSASERGKVVTLAAEGGPIEIKLEPCAVVVGRFTDRDGNPEAGVTVSVSLVQKKDNWGRRLAGGETDAEGRFRVLLPPGNAIAVSAYSPNGPSFSARVNPVSDVVYDLGEFQDGAKFDDADVQARGIKNSGDATTKPVALPATPTEVESDDWKPLTSASISSRNPDLPPANNALVSHRVRGQVVGPDGKGKQATIHLVSKRTPHGLLGPVEHHTWATQRTDDEGRSTSRFEFRNSIRQYALAVTTRESSKWSP